MVKKSSKSSKPNTKGKSQNNLTGYPVKTPSKNIAELLLSKTAGGGKRSAA